MSWMGDRKAEVGAEGRILMAQCFAWILRESFSSSHGHLHYSTSGAYERSQFTEIILRHQNDSNSGGFSLRGVVLQYLSLSYTGLRVGIYNTAGGNIVARGG